MNKVEVRKTMAPTSTAQLSILFFAVLFIVHLAWAGQFAARSLFWRMKRFEFCRSDLREWRQRELTYFEAVEEVNGTTPPEAVISVAGNSQLALELSYYCFPRIVRIHASTNAAASSQHSYIIEGSVGR